MNHTIFFNTKDELLTWLDENFSDAKISHIESNGATYETDDCILETKGNNLTIYFKTI
jgi:hypothetical protein